MKWRAYNRKRRRPDRWEVITRNDDFTDRKTDIPYLLRTHRPAVIGTQESKRTDYRAVVDTRRYAVTQDMSNAARAGVAIITDRQQAATATNMQHRALVSARGLLPRGVTSTTAWLAHRPVVLASTHRPPQRNMSSWPAFDRALRRWIRAQPHPVILMLDSNVQGRRRRKRRELKRLAKSYRMRVRGVGLDAVMINGDLRFASAARAYRRLRSDHRPVGALVRWKPRRLETGVVR